MATGMVMYLYRNFLQTKIGTGKNLKRKYDNKSWSDAEPRQKRNREREGEKNQREMLNRKTYVKRIYIWGPHFPHLLFLLASPRVFCLQLFYLFVCVTMHIIRAMWDLKKLEKAILFSMFSCDSMPGLRPLFPTFGLSSFSLFSVDNSKYHSPHEMHECENAFG